MRSVLSNHLAPSRDIAVSLGKMECIKHVVSGGWWRNTDGVYIQGGTAVRTVMNNNKQLQRRLGWAGKSAKIVPGFDIFIASTDPDSDKVLRYRQSSTHSKEQKSERKLESSSWTILERRTRQQRQVGGEPLEHMQNSCISIG